MASPQTARQHNGGGDNVLQFPSSAGKDEPGPREQGIDLVVEFEKYVEYHVEPSGAYVMREGSKHRFFARQEQIQDIVKALPQYTAQKREPPAFPLDRFDWEADRERRPHGLALKCGDLMVPLQRPLQLARRADGALVAADFDLVFPHGETQEAVHRRAIRRYREYEAKAARAALTSEEMAVWKRICSVVDRRREVELREQAKPRRALRQVLEDANGTRTVKWSSGLVLPLSQRAVAAIMVLDSGEWFEADVVQDVDGNVASLRNIDVRPDYRVATEDEIREYLDRRSGGAR